MFGRAGEGSGRGARLAVDAERRLLIVRDGAARHEIPWSDIEGGTLCRMPSLVDEIGLVLELGAGPLWLRESDADFWTLFEALALGRKLPADWYARVEAGERFDVRAGRSAD